MRRSFLFMFILVVLCIGCRSLATAGSQSTDVTAMWSDVDSLINEQKFEEAAKEVGKIREISQENTDNENWTKALVRETQLRMALHGYETSVRFLKDQTWPDDARSITILDLFYAFSLTTYIDAYSWEINQRETVESTLEVDLKKWTKDEIYEEAQKAYVDIWDRRSELSREPVESFGEFLSKNSYPDEVRGTLRHAVTYLFVELLGNTGNWRPEHLNETWQLDVSSLMTSEYFEAETVDLMDPSVHPLLKICYLLDDLETWSKKKKNPASALEAHLERLRRLHTSFTQNPDRIAIREHLQFTLSGYRSTDWWSEGMAQCAEFVRSEDDPDALRRARSIAQQGAQENPSSIGGKHCLAIIESIELPAYSVKAMKSDGKNRRSILITHRNLDRVYFRAYRIDLIQWIEQARDWNLMPGSDDIRKLVDSKKPVEEWSRELPRTPDFRDHTTYASPPMDDFGYYVVVSSSRPDFEAGNNRLYAMHLIITDLVLLTESDGKGGYRIQVVSGSTGTGIPGASVSLYKRDWQKGHHRLKTIRTDTGGLVFFRSTDLNNTRQTFLTAEYEDDVALDDANLWFRSHGESGIHSSTLIFTDRSVYRPMQRIQWKALLYQGRRDQGRFSTVPETSITISLIDPNGESVATEVKTTNRFGTASGEFMIPTGRPLGSWKIRSSYGGSLPIRIEEYKRPTFEAEFVDPDQPLRLNRPAVLKGEAHYYFGLPVLNGDVRWRITREPVYPRGWGFWWGYRPQTASQIVGSGTTQLADDGSFSISFTPEADERLAELSKETSYRFSITADITDEGGETRSATRSFRLGFISVEATITMETGFIREDIKPAFTIQRTNLDGIPRSGEGRWSLFTLREPDKALLPADLPKLIQQSTTGDAFSTPGDSMRPRWETGIDVEQLLRSWERERKIADGAVSHGETGSASISVSALPPGAYRLVYTTQDDYGSECETQKDFFVADPVFRLPVALILRAERTSVPVGETARIYVSSGLSKQLLYLEIFKAGALIKREVLDADKDETLIEIPVTKDDRGGFGVTLHAVRDHQFMRQSQTIYVPWDDRRLSVSFSTFRDKIRPKATETWTVTVRSNDGYPIESETAELLAYMYDKSLDIFERHTPPNPVSLYPSKTGVQISRATLGSQSGFQFIGGGFTMAHGYPSLVGDHLQFYSGYGIGGPGRRGMYRQHMAPAPMAMEADVSAIKSKAIREENLNALGDTETKEGLDEIRVDSTPGAGESPQTEEALRSDFAETAFWEPHLRLNDDGSASIEFQVPDPVTTWNVWVHAVTTDLKAGSLHRETQSVKELMVRPYIPRFLREGDVAEITVVVNNASDKTLTGKLSFDIIDPETEESILSSFGLDPNEVVRGITVPEGGGTHQVFKVKTPNEIGLVAIKTVATSEEFSDGEMRPIPILPSRMHLTQSRFVTLRDTDTKNLHFADLVREDDPSRINEQMVVTVDAQLFYGVLQALPYLVQYPYECTEQTLNRFVSTGIMTSLYDEYPAVKRMAEDFSERQTQYETFDSADPNRRMQLEETPWLRQARGGTSDMSDLINVLDPRIAGAQRDEAIAKLRKAQTSLGAFPWFPGGPPSPYMTLYIMYGFAKAMEFSVDVPQDMVQRGWSYLAKYYRDEIPEMMARDCCWEFLTFLNYVASCYEDVSWTGEMLTAEERIDILDFCFRHWKQHSPYLKGLLAMTLHRMDRPDDALLVWGSVMDSAKSTEDQGTYWAPEDRSWLWYNDTIETHAYALRTLTELEPESSHRHGLVQWLFLNKKLNHWKSTRATAEVIYSLVHYLKAENALGTPESVTVKVANRTTTFDFDPSKYTGKKNQIVIPGEIVGPETSIIEVQKGGKGFAFTSATWHYSTEKLPEEESGDFFHIQRRYFKREITDRGFVLKPLEEGNTIDVGDQIEVHISIRSKHRAEYVHLRDPRPAGCEPENQVSRYKWDIGIGWYEETRDSGMNFFFESLPVGEYTFKHRMRATMAGVFRIGPATMQSMYAPEFNAYSSGFMMPIHGE